MSLKWGNDEYLTFQNDIWREITERPSKAASWMDFLGIRPVLYSSRGKLTEKKKKKKRKVRVGGNWPPKGDKQIFGYEFDLFFVGWHCKIKGFGLHVVDPVGCSEGMHRFLKEI